MNALKAILFDLDDTLYPELAFVRSGFRHVAAACAARFSLDAEQVYREFFDHHHAGKRGKIFDAWLDVHHLPLSEHRDWMVAAYRHHEPTISTHDGVEPLLKQLGDKGLALGVISDGPWRMQRNKFAALGIAKHFAHVQFTDELGAKNGNRIRLPSKSYWPLSAFQPNKRSTSVTIRRRIFSEHDKWDWARCESDTPGAFTRESSLLRPGIGRMQRSLT